MNLPDFSGNAVDVAQRLLGWELLIGGVGGTIVETEAYDQLDPASHSYGGIRPRNAAMFGPAGCAYVYRSYGIHWCLNAVCGEAGHGAGVLIRALEPLYGLQAMQQRRGLVESPLLPLQLKRLCSGPGRLAQALGVDLRLAGLPLSQPPFSWRSPTLPMPSIVSGPRIGISKAVDHPWRFGVASSRFLSRPF